MQSSIPDLQINSVFYVCENHTVTETSMRTCVLHNTCTDQLCESDRRILMSLCFVNPDL